MVFILLFLCILLPAAVLAESDDASSHPSTEPGLEPILGYIAKSWDTLTRSMEECTTVVDPKLAENSVLYLPAEMTVPAQVAEMQKLCHIQVKSLPEKITQPGQINTAKLDPQGLLYLEHKYVVPGGRFNEMYGWDSYFIVRGLVRAGRIELAKGMIENFLFEIEHYGTVLNANRSYYLSRSQPPFLTSMILSVYEAEKAAGHEDKKWLERAYSYAAKDYQMWTREPHLAEGTGLSRYYDFGDLPAPESLKDETDHYRRVAAYFLMHPELDRGYLEREPITKPDGNSAGKHYAVEICESSVVTTAAKPDCEDAEGVTLSKEFYRGDRSMRESGFDVSFRFGPHGAGTHHYAAVCLNSLLYKYEKDMEAMSTMLGRPTEAAAWKERAAARGKSIQKYLWDAEQGMFFDYDLHHKERSTYIYITTFYPLWAGAATKEQAAAIMKQLAKLEQPGGLVMSPYESEGQWDFPYAWAPTQLVAIDGMRKYGFNADADRISYNFLSMIAANFRHDGTIREKYNAVTRSSETTVKAGYNINVVGFGWTNAVFLEFLHDLPPAMVAKLAAEQLVATN
ncbi:MAG TPA: trehalase family glycosidase [Candidatus Eisenbacteria bacterium]|jgi:alpha,alpha-trehalase|nr:trehalase family glycosidase [Candidatus Eisenbacteria bacterium]